MYLVPLKSQGTTDLIKALDILQNRRGKISRIVVNQLTGHVALKPKENQSTQPSLKNVSPTLKQTINNGLANLKITIAEGQRHAKVGLAESAVFSLKNC